MKLRLTFSTLLCVLSIAVPTAGSIAATPAPAVTTETIVLIRHAEKPSDDLGQLSTKGLNRSLALPNVLVGKFGKPDYLFAPDPAAQNKGFSYVRPLATIEPTAIELGLPVNTQIGYTAIADLQTELTQPRYSGKTIFVAWEHAYLDEFAKSLVQAYGVDPTTVPAWPGSDFDTIFVIRLQRSASPTTATFTIDHEGLNGKLSDTPPGPAAGG
jgi:hypothetical protein